MLIVTNFALENKLKKTFFIYLHYQEIYIHTFFISHTPKGLKIPYLEINTGNLIYIYIFQCSAHAVQNMSGHAL